MSRQPGTFEAYVQAVDALRGAFPETANRLGDRETSTQYAFSAGIDDLARWQDALPSLAAVLLPARFQLTLEVTAHDYATQLQLHGAPPNLAVDCENAVHTPDGSSSPLSPGAVAVFEDFQEQVQAGKVGIPLADVLRLLSALSAAGTLVRSSLRVFLDKKRVCDRLTAGVPEKDRPKLVAYLFPEALLAHLEHSSLSSFEQEFCHPGRRTIVPVFGMAGMIKGDILAVLGRDAAEDLERLMQSPLPDSLISASREVLEFREAQGMWPFPTSWLRPEIFEVQAGTYTGDEILVEIHQQLQSYQALLATIFLADRVDYADPRYRVEFSGFGRVRMLVDRSSLLDCQVSLRPIYQLYTYCYEGLSADKLEIAQQFLSLMAQDVPSLCRRAVEVREATKKTYDRALVDKVGAYFNARQKIQDRINAVITETTSSTIGLSRNISEDLYKVAGVIAAAAAGVLLKPDLAGLVGPLAGLIVSGYTLIILLHQLPAFARSYDLKMQQHTAYIHSFEEVLSSAEIDKLLADKHLLKAKALFSKEYDRAQLLYVAFLLMALAAVVLILWLPSGSSPAATPTPTLTP
jgi:hypothetical protein